MKIKLKFITTDEHFTLKKNVKYFVQDLDVCNFQSEWFVFYYNHQTMDFLHLNKNIYMERMKYDFSKFSKQLGTSEKSVRTFIEATELKGF